MPFQAKRCKLKLEVDSEVDIRLGKITKIKLQISTDSISKGIGGSKDKSPRNTGTYACLFSHIPITGSFVYNFFAPRINNSTYTDTGGNTRSYEPYAVADARLTYGLSPRSLPWREGRSARRRALSVSGIVLHIDANNILNTTYVDYGNVPQPGFWFAAGATVKME